MKRTDIDLAISLLGILVLGIVWGGSMAWLFSNNSPQFAVVDLQALITHHAHHLAQNPLKTISDQEIQEAGDHLKEKLEDYARKHHRILLNKRAVLGGDLPDFTADIAGIDLSEDIPRKERMAETQAPPHSLAKNISQLRRHFYAR